MQRIIIATLLALGCAGGDTTTLPPRAEAPAIEARAMLGVGEINGLPGTPLEYSANGIPIIEGVERPDYADDGINAWDARFARVAPDNPTGEYRFEIDAVGPQEWIADADDTAGFRDGLEEYTWRLAHPNYVSKKAIWRSNIYHGHAFSTNSDGSINALGACWLSQNAGRDCEFPSKKIFEVRDYYPEDTDFSDCNSPPPGGQSAPIGINQPSFYLPQGAAVWSPEVILNVHEGGQDQISVYCEDLPGSHFGGIMGRSGGFGATRRRVTNAHDAYSSSCNPGGGSVFPRGLFTYDFGELKYDPINLYDRGLLCGANSNSADMLRKASINMFAHEFGHILGFAHFTTGVMATGGNCSIFYSTLAPLPQVFHNAMNNFTPNSGTFNFIDQATCPNGAPPLLPAPADNSSNFPFGRLFE